MSSPPVKKPRIDAAGSSSSSTSVATTQQQVTPTNKKKKNSMKVKDILEKLPVEYDDGYDKNTITKGSWSYRSIMKAADKTLDLAKDLLERDVWDLLEEVDNKEDARSILISDGEMKGTYYFGDDDVDEDGDYVTMHGDKLPHDSSYRRGYEWSVKLNYQSDVNLQDVFDSQGDYYRDPFTDDHKALLNEVAAATATTANNKIRMINMEVRAGYTHMQDVEGNVEWSEEHVIFFKVQGRKVEMTFGLKDRD